MESHAAQEPDARVARLVLTLLHGTDAGWRDAYPSPAHFPECLETRVVEVETGLELWFDTGVEATHLTARLACPHVPEAEWEWADLGELPDILDRLLHD